MFQYLSIPLAVAILGIASYEDYRSAKIRNRYIILGFAASILFHATAVLLGFAAPLSLLYVALNGAAALLTGVLLWHFGLWSAGDAKLFTVAVMLLPTAMYERGGAWFPAFVLLANAFTFIFVVALWWFFRGLYVKISTSGLRSLKFTQEMTLRDAVAGMLGFMVLLILRRIFFENVLKGLGNTQDNLVYVILFVLVWPITHFFRRKPYFYIAIAVVLGYSTWALASGGLSAAIPLVKMTGVSFAVLVFRILYEYLVKDLDERTIKVGELRQGMILPDSSVRKHQIEDVVQKSDAGFIMPDGLTASQVRDITKALVAKGVAEVEVLRTAPFAIFMLLGYALTIYLGGTIRSR